MLYETKFLISLFLTLIIEIPILFIFIKYIFKLKKKVGEIIFIGFLASVLTLPYLWFILPNYIYMNYYFFIGESLVVLAESFVYKQLVKINFKKAILISLIANLVSFMGGILLLQKFAF